MPACWSHTGQEVPARRNSDARFTLAGQHGEHLIHGFSASPEDAQYLAAIEE